MKPAADEQQKTIPAVRTLARDANRSTKKDTVEPAPSKKAAVTMSEPKTAIPVAKSAIPKPPTAPAKGTDEKKSGAAEHNQDAHTIPPFHTLQKKSAPTKNKIDQATDDIKTKPQSLQEDEEKDGIEITESGKSDGAKIISDKKHKHIGLFEAVKASTTQWWDEVKNTYITPPKPTYTVGKSYRRAGVLRDAIPRTGAAMVDNKSFAERLKAQYKKTDNDSETETENAAEAESFTDPVFLPELPPKQTVRESVTDVTAIPRKTAVTKSALAASTIASPKPNTSPAIAVPNKNTLVTDSPKAIPETNTTAAAALEPKEGKGGADSLPKIAINPTESEKNKTEPTPKSAPTPVPPATATLSNTPPKEVGQKNEDSLPKITINPPSTEPKPASAVVPKEDKEVSVTSDTKPASTVPPEPHEKAVVKLIEPVPKNPEVPSARTAPAPTEKITIPTTAPAPATQTALNREQTNSIQTQPLESTQPTSEAADNYPPVADATEEYAPDNQTDDTYTTERTETNMLSLKIIAGVIAVSLVVVIVYTLSALLTPSTDSGFTPTLTFGDEIETINLNSYLTSTERQEALATLLISDSRGVLQITPYRTTPDSTFVTDPETILSALNINIPPAVLANITSVNFGSEQGTPFIYITYTDKAQLLGGMLMWERTITTDLQMVLGGIRTSPFADMERSGLDIRRTTNEPGQPQLYYTITPDALIITTAEGSILRLAE